jgi:nucleotide-binding universal stress UspA family protein
MKTILVPLDFSAASDLVVEAAARLARPFDARVVLLTVIQPPAVLAEYTPILETIAEITAAGEKNAARQLALIERKLSEEAVRAESIVATGSPVPMILEQAKETAADYIVMGSHGHTALYDLLVGSTTHGVLARARCPILIIPSAKAVPARVSRKKQVAMA